MKTRITLYADEGMILTDGEHYGRIVHLAIDADPSVYHEITEAEYKELMKEQFEKEGLINDV